jgi:hypothetical protein
MPGSIGDEAITSLDQTFGAPALDGLTLAPFAGYPYLVTRIGHSALRHVAILPADWSRARLVDLARRQTTANQLETCLCLGPGDALYLHPDGRAEASDLVPTGIPVVERLALADPLPERTDVAARRRALRAYVEAHTPGGYVVGDGLEGGQPATESDLERLDRSGADGVADGRIWYVAAYVGLGHRCRSGAGASGRGRSSARVR